MCDKTVQSCSPDVGKMGFIVHRPQHLMIYVFFYLLCSPSENTQRVALKIKRIMSDVNHL